MVVMRDQDHGRLSRILGDGTPVELEFNIVNTVYPEGRTAYNTIAEIPGTDKQEKKEEVVMLGGQLDPGIRRPGPPTMRSAARR